MSAAGTPRAPEVCVADDSFYDDLYVCEVVPEPWGERERPEALEPQCP